MIKALAANAKFLRGLIARARRDEVRAGPALPPRRDVRLCRAHRRGPAQARREPRPRAAIARHQRRRATRHERAAPCEGGRPWLDRSRQAGRDDVDTGRRDGEAAFPSQEGRPCRHARPARVRPPADRARARRRRRCRSSWTGARSTASRVRWGIETDTDDTEGRVVATSETRPARDEIEALLPRYTGADQPGPAAILRDQGRRRARLRPRPRRRGRRSRCPRDRRPCASPRRASPTEDATFEAECGKGTYVRALARDLGRDLGCRGHVVALRRAAVGPFDEQDAVTPDELRP